MSDNTSYVVSSTINLQSFIKKLTMSSSLKNMLFELDEESPSYNLETTTAQLDSDETNTSNFNNTRTSLEIEKRTLGFVAEYSKEQKDQLVERITNELVSKLRYFSYDDESMDPIWAVCDRVLEETSVEILGEALQHIYLAHNDYPNILCGVCRLLTALDLDEVTPWGPMILIGLLNHKNETVKEYSVILLDNWKDTSLIPVLRNLDCRASWLQAYINEVLLSLEG